MGSSSYGRAVYATSYVIASELGDSGENVLTPLTLDPNWSNQSLGVPASKWYYND